MKTITKPNNINQVTAYFLACGYFYRQLLEEKEIIIEKMHSLYIVSSYDVVNKEGLTSDCFNTLKEAKEKFKSFFENSRKN